MNRQALIKKFDKQAEKHNKRRKNDQAYTFRQRLFKDAKGKVLEVAIGSGLNYPFYNSDIELTGLDFSHEMLKAAQDAAKDFAFHATFIQDDVERADFSENSFDTIISSGSLCAYQDPIKVLNSFQKWCKPGGKILMLEHGISRNKLVGLAQKIINPLYVKAVGCHLNRDIAEMIQDSDLYLIKEERYMAGCVHLIWAKTDN